MREKIKDGEHSTPEKEERPRIASDITDDPKYDRMLSMIVTDDHDKTEINNLRASVKSEASHF